MIKLQELLKSKGYKIDVDGKIGPQTRGMTEDFVLKEILKRKWLVPTTSFVYLRTDNNLTDNYDDFKVRFNNGKVDKISPCTTTAGSFYVLNPITDEGITGTGIVCEQQVLKAHRFITASNWRLLWLQEPYFQQIKPLKFYRDGDKDFNIDRDKIYTGLKGFNQHHGGSMYHKIYNWSAGCMVTPEEYWRHEIEIFIKGVDYDFTLIEV